MNIGTILRRLLPDSLLPREHREELHTIIRESRHLNQAARIATERVHQDYRRRQNFMARELRRGQGRVHG